MSKPKRGRAQIAMSKPKLWPERCWAISVEIDGEQVVMVSPESIRARDLSKEERQLVCRELRNLAAFVGCEELEHG